MENKSGFEEFDSIKKPPKFTGGFLFICLVLKKVDYKIIKTVTLMDSKKTPAPVQEYSEAFKRQVVSEYERGLFTKSQLQTRYNIRGNSCISRWLIKYGNFTYETQLSKGRPMKDPQKQKIKELEAALAKKEEELRVFRQFIEIAERELKIEIVKKSGSNQSRK